MGSSDFRTQAVTIVACIPAGSIPGKFNAIEKALGARNKALILLNGRVMIDYVLAAVKDSQRIDEIYIVGLAASDIDCKFKTQVTFIPSRGSRFDSVAAAARHASQQIPRATYLMNVASDLPLLDGNSLTNLIDAVDWEVDYDCVIPIIRKDIYNQQYPDIRKHFRKFEEGYYSPCDVFFFKPVLFENAATHAAIKSIVKHRTSLLNILLHFSIAGIYKYCRGNLSIFRDIIPFLESKFELRIGVIEVSDARGRADLDYAEDVPEFERLLREKDYSKA